MQELESQPQLVLIFPEPFVKICWYTDWDTLLQSDTQLRSTSGWFTRWFAAAAAPDHFQHVKVREAAAAAVGAGGAAWARSLSNYTFEVQEASLFQPHTWDRPRNQAGPKPWQTMHREEALCWIKVDKKKKSDLQPYWYKSSKRPWGQKWYHHQEVV